MRDGRMATFAELLRLMNDHQVPMPEAVVLAADASGDRMLSRGARRIAERLESGAVLRSRSELPAEFPPLLGWSDCIGGGAGGVEPRVGGVGRDVSAACCAGGAVGGRVSADHLDRRDRWQCGAASTSLVVFWPFTRLLYQLGLPQ